MTQYQSEAQFQEAVIEYAKARGWMVHAERPARSDKGWRTPVQGDAGFPDLVLARAGVVWLWELKSEKGNTSGAQEKWYPAIGALAKVLYPHDWPWIERELA